MAIKNGKYIIEYLLEIENISPLIVANSESEPLINEEENKVYIPGTTIAGALRSYIKKNFHDLIDFNELFPENQKNQKGNKVSKIFCYDSSAYISGYEIRPAVSINEKSGANDNKFERKFLEVGHKFKIKIELYNDDKSKLAMFEKAVDSCIVALNEGNIALGSYKSVGAGVFKVNSTGKKHYDLSLKSDLLSYLKQNKLEEEISIEKLKENSFNNDESISFKLIGEFKTPVLIKGYSTLESNDTDGTPLRDNKGNYIIPGSAIKGVIRSESKRILSYLDRNDIFNDIFGFSNDADKNSGGISKLTVFDSVINKDEGNEIIYNKIHIDRFTGGVSKSALMDDTTIKPNILVKAKYKKSKDEELDKSAIALIALVFRNMAIGDLSLGGGNSVGRGRITAVSLIINNGENILFKGDINNNNISINKLDDYIKCLNVGGNYNE